MTTWILAADRSVGGLLALVQERADPVRLVVARPEPTVPVEALAPGVAAVVLDGLAKGDLVVASDRAAGRALAASVAVASGLPMLSGVVRITDRDVELRRCGGRLTEHVDVGRGLVVVADGGSRVADLVPDVVVTEPGLGATVTQVTPGTVPAHLGEARRVVAVGRDLASDPAARALANAWDAEVAATRPAADELGWGRDRYVGASGLHIAPELYVALGVSGQPQHLEGCRDARRIVAINTDPSAPIWAHTDYGIVGDARVLAAELAGLVDRADETDSE